MDEKLVDDNPYQAPQSQIEEVADEAAEDEREAAARVPHHEYDPTGLLFADAARQSGLNINALRFVFDAKVNARDFVANTPEGRLGGPKLCIAVVGYAEELYRGEGLAALNDWGLTSGRDVRQVVEALVQNGLLEPRDNDGADDLGGLGPLAQFAGVRLWRE